MNNTNETVAEILCMMRDARNLDPSAIEDNNRLLSDYFYDDECQGWLSSYADRIEAAHRCEMDGLRSLVGELAYALDASCDCHCRCDGCKMADESKFDCPDKAWRALVSKAREVCR